MNHLVCNAARTHLYKKNSHLVRTPITIALSPDGRAYYAVPEAYDSNDWPAHGFIRQANVANGYAVGYDMLSQYTSPSNPLQIWREVSTSHDPETVWYHGAYATSAATLQGASISCEAYMQLSGYHFTFPASFSGLSLTAMTVKFTLGGVLECYGSPAAQSNNNGKWNPPAGDSYMRFSAVASLGNYSNLSSTDYQSVNVSALTDSAITAGANAKGARDLWGFGSSTRDGGIPALSGSPLSSFSAGSDILDFFNTNRDGWIVPWSGAEITSSTKYRPLYVPSTPYWWACISLWSLSLTATFE